MVYIYKIERTYQIGQFIELYLSKTKSERVISLVTLDDLGRYISKYGR